MLIWIIDEEWKDYDLEKEFLKKKYPDVEIRCSTYDYENDLEEFGYKADGILAQVYAPIPRETIEKLVNCKGIAVYGGGYDKVDIIAAREKNISVTNISGYCAEDLADYVLAAIYFANKKIAQYSNAVIDNIKENKWGAMSVNQNVHRLSNQKLLIVGFGVIGKQVAKKAKAVGLDIIAFDDFVGKKVMSEHGVRKVSWEEGFKEADYVSINLKGCDENKDKVTYNEFKLMKNTSWLINTSRGKVVSEVDLIKAIKEKEIEGAILDVIKNEPPTGKEDILYCENVFITPHVSYISYESFKSLKEFALENLTAMLEGENPRDLVN